MLPAGVFINYITTTQAPPRVVWSFLWWTSMTMGYLLDGVMGCTLNASLSPSSSNSSPNHNELYSPNKKLPFWKLFKGRKSICVKLIRLYVYNHYTTTGWRNKLLKSFISILYMYSIFYSTMPPSLCDTCLCIICDGGWNDRRSQ